MRAIPFLSIVVAVFNEEDNIRPLAEKITAALTGTPWSWEILFVNDGSRDESESRIRELRAQDPRIRLINLDANHGQTAAWDAGFRCSRGEIIATIDADLQNDPADLPMMLARLLEEKNPADVVCGIRTGRKDTLSRKIQSRIGNGFRSWMTGRVVQDAGCSLRVMRQEFVKDLPLHSGLHRFLPTLLSWRGAKIIEVPVRHHARASGQSKYGLRNRAWSGLQDLFAVRWMRTRFLNYRLSEDPE